jgi:hypothetical protein
VSLDDNASVQKAIGDLCLATAGLENDILPCLVLQITEALKEHVWAFSKLPAVMGEIIPCLIFEQDMVGLCLDGHRSLPPSPWGEPIKNSGATHP